MAPLSRKSEQARITRAALIAAARDAFGAHGYSDTAIDDIVRRAEVTKGAFYHHFSGKDDLFRTVFEEVKQELSGAAFITHVDHEPFAPRQDMARPLNRFAEQDNDEVWRQLVDRCRRYIALHTAPAVRRIVLVDARWVLPRETWTRIEAEHGVVLLRADLRRAMRRGIIRPAPLPVLAAILSGTLNETCLIVAEADDQERALDEAMVVIERFLDGLRAGPDGADS